MENIYGPWGTGVEAYLRHDYANAERCFRSASPSSKICFNLGMALMVQFRFQEAIEAFNQALEYDDWMAISYFQRGNSYFMLGQYDEAIKSWNDAKENIRHGEVVDYDSLHLSYMLCKSEIALNISIAFYYCDMTDECNAMLDEARRYSIVKDDIPAVTQQMIGGEDIYPCTLDDTALFNPPKLPQSVVDAMKKGNTNSWGSSPSSTPSYSSSPPSYSSPPSTSFMPKLAPPARSAPAAPPKKTGLSNSGGSNNGPPPPPPPKKALKKGFGKMAAKKAPAKQPAGFGLSQSPPPFSHSAAAKSPVYAPSPSFGASPSSGAPGGGPPPPPPIPSGGIPVSKIPAAESSYSGSSSGPSRAERTGPALPFSADNLRDALSRRNMGGSTTASSNGSSQLGSSSSARATPSPSSFGLRPTASPGSGPGSRTSPANHTTSPTGPSSLKLPVRSAPPLPAVNRPAPSASISEPTPISPRGGPAPTSPRGGTAPGSSFGFKILAEQGPRKKKVEATVGSPAELREQIASAFAVDLSTLIEYYDPDFGEFVELDNGVNLSSLPTMLKARVAGA